MAAEQQLNWQKILDEAIDAPGNLGDTYNRFHDYSLTNMLLFMMQGVREPVASYSRWKAMGRQVIQGSRAKEVIVPVLVNERPAPDETLEEKRERVARLIGFKVVRAIFALSETEGAELPPPVLPGWDLQTALTKLHVDQGPFRMINGNVQGYAVGREVAINPVAVNPAKTMFHELGHIVLGHTVATTQGEYAQHRGLMEFQAEAVAHLAMNELGQLTPEAASESRGYLQHYLQGERPGDREIRLVFSATEQILRAGRVAVDQGSTGKVIEYTDS